MMRSKLLPYLWMIILIFGVTGCVDSTTNDSEGIRASGFIESQVYTIASSQGGKVVEVMVRPGDQVEAGDLLVMLDETQFENLRDQAQAGVNAAQAALAALQEKPTAREVAEAEAAVRSAKAELAAMEAERDLLLSSYAPLEPPEMKMNTAESSINVAEAGVTLAEAQLTRVEAEPLDAERAILIAELDEAQANLVLIERQLEALTLVAPIDSVVLQVMNREGEVVSPGSPVLYLVDPEHLTLRLFIPVTQVAKINIGDKFEISTDAYPDEVFSGSVIRIADEAQFTPATVLTQEERVKLVFAVELLLEDPSGKVKPGMPADAVIMLERDSS